MSKTTKMIVIKGFGEFKSINEMYQSEKELINLGYLFTVVNSKFKLAIYLSN